MGYSKNKREEEEERDLLSYRSFITKKKFIDILEKKIEVKKSSVVLLFCKG